MSTLKVALPHSKMNHSDAAAVSLNDAVADSSFVRTVTLGCKVNEYESRMIAEQLANNGYQDDVILVNTCTVTQEADRQSRQAIRKAIRQWHQEKGSLEQYENEELGQSIVEPFAKPKVVVTGCYAQMNPEEIADINGVDLIVGNDKKMTIAQMLIAQSQPNQVAANEVLSSDRTQILVGNVDEHVSLPEGILGDFEGQTRAFIQIQQGCNQGCTFCIIHKARGQSRSFALDDVVAQCKRLLQAGFKEFVICGVDLGAYGEDFTESNTNLVTLLTALLGLSQDNNTLDYRLRLSSIDPAHITDELIELFSHPKICPHIHLSLQSGANLILKRMKRRYSIEQAIKAIDALRAKRPELVLSADVMVGFPTETDEHFEQTMIAVKRLDIAFPHVFIYSNRDGTPAAKIPNQVSADVKKTRSETLRALGQEIKSQTFNKHLGKTYQVLVENNQDKEARYLSRADNYLPIRIVNPEKNGKVLPNTHQIVTIFEQNNDFLIAHLAEGK